MSQTCQIRTPARFHLPGLFEFTEFCKAFLPLWREHREYFRADCEIASIYGAPGDCLWGGGRVGCGQDDAHEVAALMREYGLSARLTFSNSLLRSEHLADERCNALCALFEHNGGAKNGVIVHSELLLDYLRRRYPGFCFISSTTKTLTRWEEFAAELGREEFACVVPDFRMNKQLSRLYALPQAQKDKVEFLCNECCSFSCADRKACYESVSRLALGEEGEAHICRAPGASEGYLFSRAMKNPGFIDPEEIRTIYQPMGFSNFKLEGRGLGSALLLEFLLYYLVRPEYRLTVREKLYLSSSLDLF